MSESVIRARNLSKAYKLYDRPIDRVRDALLPLGAKKFKLFYALNNIDLDIPVGQTVGLIGENGSGKSTFLKIVTGILMPSAGEIAVNGRIAALLELGAGFNPEMTGLENIFFLGTINGYTRAETKEMVEPIIEFADIGDYINQPVKLYSSGMFVRLAFAVAITVQPDILLVDEALSVGDIRFQQKCFRKIQDFKESGKTILFVSHDMNVVKNYCSRVIWLKEGLLHRDGDAEDVIKDYISFMSYNRESSVTQRPVTPVQKSPDAQDDEIPWKPVEGVASFGEGKASIVDFAFLEADTGEDVTILCGGERVVLHFRIAVSEDIAEPIVGFIVKDKLGNQILGSNSYIQDISLPPFKAGEAYTVRFSMTFPPLTNGYYFLSTAVAEGSQLDHVPHHWVHDIVVIRIDNNRLAAKLGHLLLLDDIDLEVNRTA